MKRSRRSTGLQTGSVRMVTPLSPFNQPEWRQVHNTPGQKSAGSTLDWRKVQRRDGSNLWDHGPKELLNDLMEFISSEINAPRGTERLGPGSMATMRSSLSNLIEWMHQEGLERISDIDNEMSWNYVDWLMNDYGADHEVRKGRCGRKREMTVASGHRQIILMRKIYDCRSAMERAGASFMTEPPFDNEPSANKVVQESMGLRRLGRLKPIPDEVFIPVVSVAQRYLEGFAEDIISLQMLALDMVDDYAVVQKGESGTDYVSYSEPLHEALRTYSFKSDPGTLVPWGFPIAGQRPYTPLDGRDVELTPVQQLRRLIVSVLRAAAVLTQALTGMRAHELCSIRTEALGEDGLPTCIKREITEDGLFEVFYVAGETAKGRKESTRWVVGARPVGDPFIPPVVQALSYAARISQPWRELAGIKNVFLTFSASRGLPRQPESVGLLTSSTLTVWQREFMYDFVDFSDIAPSKDQKIDLIMQFRAHRWRPTFAQHLFRTDPRLLPAISEHFKHASEVMTLRGYIGNDPSLKISFEAAHVQAGVDILMELTSGAQEVAGPLARLVSEHRQQMNKTIRSQPGKTLDEKLTNYVKTHEIAIWNAPHGSCLMSLMPERSRCRKVANETSWSNQRPNLAVRTPSLCAGCECLYVRLDHEQYWRESYEEYSRAMTDAREEGREQEFRVVEQRMKIAEHFLGAIEGARRSKPGGENVAH